MTIHLATARAVIADRLAQAEAKLAAERRALAEHSQPGGSVPHGAWQSAYEAEKRVKALRAMSDIFAENDDGR